MFSIGVTVKIATPVTAFRRATLSVLGEGKGSVFCDSLSVLGEGNDRHRRRDNILLTDLSTIHRGNVTAGDKEVPVFGEKGWREAPGVAKQMHIKA